MTSRWVIAIARRVFFCLSSCPANLLTSIFRLFFDLQVKLKEVETVSGEEDEVRVSVSTERCCIFRDDDLFSLTLCLSLELSLSLQL